jgi:hypothetical protein
VQRFGGQVYRLAGATSSSKAALPKPSGHDILVPAVPADPFRICVMLSWLFLPPGPGTAGVWRFRSPPSARTEHNVDMEVGICQPGPYRLTLQIKFLSARAGGSEYFCIAANGKDPVAMNSQRAGMGFFGIQSAYFAIKKDAHNLLLQDQINDCI